MSSDEPYVNAAFSDEEQPRCMACKKFISIDADNDVQCRYCGAINHISFSGPGILGDDWVTLVEFRGEFY